MQPPGPLPLRQVASEDDDDEDDEDEEYDEDVNVAQVEGYVYANQHII
jgi:hypothetical protein